MIIARAPLRITLGGGGTDLPSYSSKYEGFCISATISKYTYVLINNSFRNGIHLKYSKSEEVLDIYQIQHDVFREALKWFKIENPKLEIVSIADVPSNGAGLGNSGAFTVALLKALFSYQQISTSQQEIADIACTINMEILGKTQGKQDEFATATGGLNCFVFKRDGSVECSPLRVSQDTLLDLEENLLLFYTGKNHNTEFILNDQEKRTKAGDAEIIKNLNETKQVGSESAYSLVKGDVKAFAELLNRQWELKERRMPQGNSYLRSLHYSLNKHGALGSKLVGSGMGGFFMVYAEDKNKLRKHTKDVGLEELRFSLTFEGVGRMM